jgi:IMP dehydrogenase
MLKKVKNFENGFILEPAVLHPEATVVELDNLRKLKKISGVPVTVDGKMGSKLIGLISNRDTDVVKNRDLPISQFR